MGGRIASPPPAPQRSKNILHPEGLNTKIFMDVFEKKDLSQIIDFPSNVKNNIFDLFLLDVPERINEMHIPGYLDIIHNSSFDICLDAICSDWKKADISANSSTG